MIKTAERKSTAYDPYKALGLAIIEAAATDYKEALVKHDDIATAENEKFFRSEWAQSLSDIDTVVLMAGIRKMIREVA
ncbi:MAG: hypothetical protein NC093_10750 [Alistipes sp.]|nr:hypothetical protein [Alistipes sp.]